MPLFVWAALAIAMLIVGGSMSLAVPDLPAAAVKAAIPMAEGGGRMLHSLGAGMAVALVVATAVWAWRMIGRTGGGVLGLALPMLLTASIFVGGCDDSQSDRKSAYKDGYPQGGDNVRREIAKKAESTRLEVRRKVEDKVFPLALAALAVTLLGPAMAEGCRRWAADTFQIDADGQLALAWAVYGAHAVGFMTSAWNPLQIGERHDANFNKAMFHGGCGVADVVGASDGRGAVPSAAGGHAMAVSGRGGTGDRQRRHSQEQVRVGEDQGVAVRRRGGGHSSQAG